MFGVVLAAIGAFFEELSASIAKTEVRRRQESVYAMGFLNALWGVLFFFVLTAWNFHTQTLTAWPTFLVRVALSILQAYLTVKAIATSDRSTFGFIRTGTIPLLLVGDMLLGNFISGYRILGVLLISVGLLFLYMNHGFSKKGMAYVILSALNAVLTIGLFKYNITHGNSIELEQFLSTLILLVFFYVMSRHRSHEHPFAMLKKPLLAIQSGAIGVAAVFDSFAYLFAPASVILAATRSSTVVFTVLSGGVYFHEKRLGVKVASLAAFIGGIVLLAVG